MLQKKPKKYEKIKLLEIKNEQAFNDDTDEDN